MKILVANRGEIAIRILRTCRDLGVQSVAVYSEADRDALHTRYADEAIAIGPAAAAESYLNIATLLDVARRSGVDAVHPGYGFLSENADFARAVEAAGFTFIGPRPETIALTGDKLAARKAARDAGLPVLPGPDTPIDKDVPIDLAAQVQYPVLVKAIAGGGGRGIRLARRPEELAPMIAAARKEARAAFGDDTVYLEPLVQQARHIEVQILGDGQGHILCLGERECSIQRRRQKLIEESPAHGLTDDQRHHLCESAVRLARALNYRSLGTVEFLLDAQGQFHFIEVNPRIQVEHPVTEMVTGYDLMKWMIRVAAGETFTFAQDDVVVRGHAIECRINAENPERDFMPCPGRVFYYHAPGGPGIRVDTHVYSDYLVPPHYDSLLAKIIAYGEDREEAVARMRRALTECVFEGLPTSTPFHLEVLDNPVFLAGKATTRFLEEELTHLQENLRVRSKSEEG